MVRALEKVGILEKFANISSGYLLPSKPAPDVFRLAAALNNVPCKRCVVFEDSLAGMKGAKNAGMKCVGIATSVPVSQMVDADIRLEKYDPSVVERVEKLFSDI
ncbi:MAG: HAD family phosphatase [Eubacterium sp.]|nr:HAD family phosphatase [Eubacterium sp.]